MRSTIALPIGLLSALTLLPTVAQAQPRKRTYGAVVIVSTGKAWKMAAKVMKEVEQDPHGMTARWIVVDRGKPDEPHQMLRDMLKRIRKARRLIFKLKLRRAKRRLKRVIADLKPLIVKRGSTPGLMRRYLQAYSYLGATYQLDADTGRAKEAFAVALSVAPNRKLSAKYFSAEAIAGFNQIKRSLKPSATLRVNTDGPTLIFVDGHYKGVAPAVITGLLPGQHVVELRRLGYLRITRFVEVSSKFGATMKARVVKDLSESELRKQMKTVEQALRRRKRPTKELAALAKLMKINQLLVCRASIDDGEASLFDADSNKFVKRVRRIAALPGSPPAKAIARALKNTSPTIDLQGGPAATGGACEDSEDCSEGYCSAGRCVSETPIYKKWWFWTLIGVAAAAVAAGGAVLGTMPQRPVLRITIGDR